MNAKTDALRNHHVKGFEMPLPSAELRLRLKLATAAIVLWTWAEVNQLLERKTKYRPTKFVLNKPKRQ